MFFKNNEQYRHSIKRIGDKIGMLCDGYLRINLNTNKKILELKSKDSIKRKRQDRDEFFLSWHKITHCAMQCCNLMSPVVYCRCGSKGFSAHVWMWQSRLYIHIF